MCLFSIIYLMLVLLPLRLTIGLYGHTICFCKSVWMKLYKFYVKNCCRQRKSRCLPLLRYSLTIWKRTLTSMLTIQLSDALGKQQNSIQNTPLQLGGISLWSLQISLQNLTVTYCPKMSHSNKMTQLPILVIIMQYRERMKKISSNLVKIQGRQRGNLH